MKTKNLEILAAEIGQEIKEKNAELEARDIEVPKEYHEEMLAFIRKLDQETARKEKQQVRQRWLRTAAVFLVCFVGLNAAVLGTSEAYREKVFSLFYDNEQGGITLNFDPGHELIEEWDDYWYPHWLPEGYQLYAAEKTGHNEFLLFMSQDMKDEIRINVYLSSSITSFDMTWMTKEELDVGIYDGYYFYNEEQKLSYAVLGVDESVIVIEYLGQVDKTLLETIAENMKKREK
ncbi:MAG: hypothetical protein IKU09_01955 [Firmicutes bacterium]|nr:hypothetical protein [Bacillota bacterium]